MTTYSQDEIARKALSLEGVLVPITAKANRDLLKGAGFARVDCFWRWCNFAGWLAIK
jgi:tRNA (cmo5U34)-methyltransferase